MTIESILSKMTKDFVKSLQGMDQKKIDKALNAHLKAIDKVYKSYYATEKKRKTRSDKGQPRGYTKFNKVLNKAKEYDEELYRHQKAKFKDIGGLQWDAGDKLKRQALTKELKESLKEAVIDIAEEEKLAQNRLSETYKGLEQKFPVVGDVATEQAKFYSKMVKDEVAAKYKYENKKKDFFDSYFPSGHSGKKKGRDKLDKKYKKLDVTDPKRQKYEEAINILSNNRSTYASRLKAMEDIEELEKKKR